MPVLRITTKKELDKGLKADLSYQYGFMKPNSLKYIDCVCKISDENEVWIIEAKKELNYEAIGQVLTYSDLFSLDYPCLKIRKAIICEKSDPPLENTCKKREIEVFVIKEKELSKK